MELMVGLTIGLLVVLAAVGSLVYTKISSTVVGDSARLQQKADAVFRIIDFHIAQAGAIELTSNTNDAAKVVFSTAFTGFNPAATGATGNQIFAIHGLDGASNAPDTLRVSYQDNGTVHDCLGNRPNTANINIRVDSQLSVLNGNLMCQGANSTTTAQSIADGVEDFQVSYGVQTLNAAGAPQYQFYPADLILDWTNIQAVAICLQLTGDNKGNPQPGLVIKGCRNQTITNDGLLRRVYQRTFSLRNALT
jgi:type IV pilus assembly protein PilW